MACNFRLNKLLAVSLTLNLALLSGAGTAGPVQADEASKNNAKNVKTLEYKRLPGNCQPERYDLYFEPDLENGEFEGTETLFFTVSQSTSEIVLNAVDLSVFEATVAQTKPTHGDWVKADIVRDKEGEKLTLKLAKALKPGQYELALKFNGKLSSKMEGFYLSTFKGKDGKEHKIATTQMEPTDARRMFPCFDEPASKAVFKVTVAIDPALVAISNAGIEFEKLDQRKNKKIVTFKATPKMSTYLFALIVGPLQSTEPVVVNGKKIRVWFTEGKGQLATYALDAAAKLLPYYENYFGQPYPLDKLDLIGIPDFSAGAMENLGAITFRENALLVDEKNSALSSRTRVVNIVAHEMAHLWFGDLVTMKWWDDLWLNEAFATWMADKAEDVLKPEWRIWDDFAVERAGTLDADAIVATRSVQSPVNSPNDALEMFDEITYSKGAALLRMLETYLGEDKFQKGIQAYMKTHAFNNASTNDLWDALSSASGSSANSSSTKKNAKDSKKGQVDVAKLMDAWVHQPGCPIVSFGLETKPAAAKKNEPFKLELSQRRFFLDSAKDTGISNSSTSKSKAGFVPWQIPLALKAFETGSDKAASRQAELLTLAKGQVAIVGATDPLMVNATGNGYFRTNYDLKQWAELQKHASPALLNVSERVSVLSDLFAISVAGLLPIDRYLQSLEKFASDHDPYVQGLAISQISELEQLLEPDSKSGYQAFVVKCLKPQLDRLGYTRKATDDDLTAELRARLIRTLGTIGNDKQVIAFCKEKFEAYLADDKTLDGDLLSPIVQVMAYNGDSDEFVRIEEAWRNSTTPEARNRNLFALAAFRDKECVEKALNLCFNKEVKAQDVPHLLARLIGSSDSQVAAFKFLGDHWQEIYDKVGERKMPDIVEACRNFNKPGQLETLKAFIAAHPMPSGRRSAAKTIEFATIGTNFKAKQSASLAQFFAGK
jgi:puromycin-sensitive aminopeptidase